MKKDLEKWECMCYVTWVLAVIFESLVLQDPKG